MVITAATKASNALKPLLQETEELIPCPATSYHKHGIKITERSGITGEDLSFYPLQPSHLLDNLSVPYPAFAHGALAAVGVVDFHKSETRPSAI